MVEHFDAFISYSHAADGRLAPAVQSGLQRLAKKVFQPRALRVFRDETGLSTNPHLWGSIETAIDAADWFVLLASPESAASEWVSREVVTWLERKPLDHILIVVTDGTIAFQPDADLDPITNCLPQPLVDTLDHEPRWLDLRWARDDTQLDLRNGRIRAAVADLAAPIHGLAKDELESDDVRQQQRAKRLAITGVTAVAKLAIASTVAALVAVKQADRADNESRLHTGGQDGHLRTYDTSTWEMTAEQLLTMGQFALRHSQLDEDGTTIIVPAESGEIFLVDEATSEIIGKPFISAGTQIQRATLVQDGATLAAQGRDGKMRLWDVATHRLIGRPLDGHFDHSETLERIDDDTLVSGGGADGQIIQWELDPDVWLERACALAGRNLTRDEWLAYVGGDYQVTCDQWPAAP